MDRASILAAMAAAAPKPTAVDMPAWGGTVYVKVLTLAQAEAIGPAGGKYQLARGLASVVVDENGERIFDPDNEDDLQTIGSQSLAVLGPLITAANDTNAAGADAIEKLGNGSTSAKSS